MRKLNDWLESYLEYTKDCEAPQKFHEWCGVSTLAAALERKNKLVWGSLVFYPNFYIVLVAPSGKARKSTAMGHARKFMADLGVRMSVEATTREKLICRLEEATDSTLRPDKGSVITHSSMTVMASELTVFLGYNNLVLMSDLTDWYDCARSWTYETKGAGSNTINGVYVNLLGGTTPSLIQSALPLDAIGGGLTSRMIMVYEPARRFKEPLPFFQLSDEGQKLRVNLTHDLTQIKSMMGNFKATKDMMNNYYEWYKSMPEESPFDPKYFAGYWSRRPNHVMKLALVLCASRTDSMIIETKDLIRAIKLLEETEKKMPNAFRGVGRSDKSETTELILTEIIRKGEVTNVELMSNFYSDCSSWDMDRILLTLETAGLIDIIATGNPSIRIIKAKSPKEMEA